MNYTRGEQDDAEGISAPADRVPPLNGRIAVDFSWHETLNIEPYLIFAREQNRLSDRDVRDSRIDPDGTDGWMTANLEARWEPGDQWLIRLSALNVFDERFRVHGSGLDAPGRNLRLNLRYRW